MWNRFGRYLKTAFATRWNLLFFGAGVAASLISGFPTVVLPIVAAGEILYLANMIGNERFRDAVDAQEAKARRASASGLTKLTYDRIRASLPPELVRRFDQLRDHCERLVHLAGSLRGPAEETIDRGSLESLDRLLWGYLRMLWGANTLSEFLKHTDDGQIRGRIEELERRLASLPKATPEDPLRAALVDNLATTRERLSNIEEARRKLDVVAAEVERMESKIASLAESSVAKRDVGDLAQRVAEVAEGVRRTDETMRQLQLPPELEDFEDPPELLREHA
ncbi:MAG: hypothetical protein ACKOCN_05090 [Planctomycetaceae bacterium]